MTLDPITLVATGAVKIQGHLKTIVGSDAGSFGNITLVATGRAIRRSFTIPLNVAFGSSQSVSGSLVANSISGSIDADTL